MNLKNKFGEWALVTGASCDIGAEFARQLPTQGFNLVLATRRIEVLDKLGKALAGKYRIKFRSISCDFADVDDIEILKQTTDDLSIGLLVSNAGTGYAGKFLSTKMEDLLWMIKLNSISHVILTHHFGGKMKAREKRGVILVSAMGVADGAYFFPASTKSLVTSFSKGLHTEFKKHNIDLAIPGTSPANTPVFEKIGFTPETMPTKPLSTRQTFLETLEALDKKHMIDIPGFKFRLLNSKHTCSGSRKMTAKALLQNK